MGCLRLIVVSLSLVWLVLAGRLIQLQLIDRQDSQQQAFRQRKSTDIIPARPGEILDRRGRLLAATIARSSLYIVPTRIDDPNNFAGRLAGAICIDAAALAERLTNHADRHFLWVRRRLNDGEVAAIERLDLPKGTWGLRREFLRSYPQGRLAAHVLGLRDVDGRARGGIEQRCDNVLRGRNGRRTLIRDARGRVIEVDDEQSLVPRQGHSVILSLDMVVQLYVEDELDRVMDEWRPLGACATVVDPASGEILAMASRPTFDPNRPTDVPPAAWTNRNIASIYEPGSTLKPFIVAWAIDQGLLAPDEEFDCEHGAWRMGRRTLHDHHPYGVLNVTDILVKSSNIGMAKIASRLGNDGLFAAVTSFGFGSRTGVGLPSELTGLVRPLREWTSYSTGSIPMGQELGVTPLQLLTAHAALAGGGVLKSPRLLLAHVDAFDGRLRGAATADAAPAIVASRAVSPETARWVVEQPLVEVVRRGTGRAAQLDGYTVFGKTGTAQLIDPQTGTYSPTRHVCSFVCGGPAGQPRALVLVVVDQPSVDPVSTHGGGTVAAPAASRILDRTLRHLGVPTSASPVGRHALRNEGRE